MIDIGLYIVYALFFVAAGAAIVLPLLSALKSPKNLGKSGIALGVLVALFGISYGLAGGELNPKWQALGVTTEFSSKLIGAGLTMFYFVMISAILIMLYSEISKAFK
ncbi:MAG TPA: hypothetical protein PLR06_11140 [Cyclobacteriaceae bacterium]|nr:hypothetical protein [Cyclobacteriaceae bacterium]